ncbi:MAG: 2-hydroxychromene-2-carboxylate isomerase [Chromatiales bacterium]|nr:MAG: 2-hydroxychromene-2-carboxylate isomerase [Chromatiales bacterium]
MSIKRKARSHFLNVLLSPGSRRVQRSASEMRRKLTGSAHVVSAFLQLDDPYSYLLAYYLPELQAHYDIELRVYLSQALGDEYQPAPDMLAEYAAVDARRLARELGIPFLDRGTAPPVEHRRGLLDELASQVHSPDFVEEFRDVLTLYWRGDNEAAARRSDTGVAGAADLEIEASQELQSRLGHYNSAMLHYGGEWFWGVDRLHFLADRLNDLGVSKDGSNGARLAALRQATQVALPVRPPAAAKELPPLELFVSFRSPYSYLALRRTFEIADAFGLELRVRPVLPMVMRGMQVPYKKLLYIARDTSREAERLGVPYGKIADPVGAGVERCLAVFLYAESERKGREFLLNAGTAIWSEAVDVATDKGMRKVTGRTGLFWPDVLSAMESEDWRTPIEANREAMMQSGSWGVPTLRLGDEVFWGQDRDWLLVRHIEELCDSGDGILV